MVVNGAIAVGAAAPPKGYSKAFVHCANTSPVKNTENMREHAAKNE